MSSPYQLSDQTVYETIIEQMLTMVTLNLQ